MGNYQQFGLELDYKMFHRQHFFPNKSWTEIIATLAKPYEDKELYLRQRIAKLEKFNQDLSRQVPKRDKRGRFSSPPSADGVKDD